MEIMNLPQKAIHGTAEILLEYSAFQDVRRTARVFGTSAAEVRKILKAAGIEVPSHKKPADQSVKS